MSVLGAIGLNKRIPYRIPNFLELYRWMDLNEDNNLMNIISMIKNEVKKAAKTKTEMVTE
jgi:hypothetical protein